MKKEPNPPDGEPDSSCLNNNHTEVLADTPMEQYRAVLARMIVPSAPEPFRHVLYFVKLASAELLAAASYAEAHL
ncbi:hypothetical protein P3T23_006174 [Paraburkholderia sp. GAS448]|uniref:hypothetical protein n=1 Tax=Paraburkholderia sp. GAS448 TaxID=3035136 RepID=UPI003D25332A